MPPHTQRFNHLMNDATKNDSAAAAIPNRFDFAQDAAKLFSHWESEGCFNAEVNPNKKPYTIVIPPPNVTGALHLGHALNNTLQDIQIRMHRMMGYEALWMPGTDHAGIATQAVVEKRLKEQENKTRHDLGREQLVRRIWDWKAQYEARILGQLKRMGCSCDWRRTRFTLDDRCAKAVRTTFHDLFSKDLIYRGKRLVNWDTYLQTAVSDDEVFHEVVKGSFWHFQYPVINPKPGEPTHVTIATTRPETMLGDTAVAVHPDPTSALDKAELALKERLAAAGMKDKPAIQTQIDDLQSRRETLLPQLVTLAKMASEGRMLRLPLADREIPLVADVWAKPELGSGCVKITPAHDPNDYEVGKRASLPFINILNVDGTLNSNGGPYAGLTMPKARLKVVADMDSLGLLAETEDREIDLAHSDRSKTPIEPYLADQWFVRMDKLAQSAMDAVTNGEVKIFPERYAKSYLDWLGEKRDWPVGRQLWWGHQIPIWSKSFETQSAAEGLLTKLLALSESKSGLVKSHLEVPEGNSTAFVIHVCIRDEDPGLETKIESLGLVRQQDVLDTWFSSALWPHSTLGWPDKTEELAYFYPTNTLITSRDIITLWVARMVLMGLNNLNQIPFSEVFIHPKILDGYGETMSKSKGNGVDPIDVIDKFGPDALRFGLCWLATDTQDVRMPVQYECPHCEALVNQTKENRQKHRIKCEKCGKEFSTQWAESDADKLLPKAPVVSERFEVARNFVNKLWNASRFAMINLESVADGQIDVEAAPLASLPLEDQWILSRLSTVTDQVTDSLKAYRYAEAARFAYEFAWDDFCSLYVEIAKPRMQNADTRAIAQSVMRFVLDSMLRLLHPIVPFVTEAIWQHMAEVLPKRTLQNRTNDDSKWIMLSDWPTAIKSHVQPQIENQFAQFTALLGAIREIRSRQNIAPKESLECYVRCDAATEKLLAPMQPFLQSMAGATVIQWSESPTIPNVQAHMPLEGMDVYVDLGKFIDIGAEIARNTKLLENLIKQIQGKEGKLSNESFVARAPAEVVKKERESLDELINQRVSTEAALEKLRSM
jgi:valyl-tRNA synthetase